MKDKSYYLQDGIDALNEGRKEEARRLLSAVIRDDPENEAAWLGMAYAVEEEERYIECMQRVLAINPENESAKKVLVKSETSQKLSEAGDKIGRYGIAALALLMVICIPAILLSSAFANFFSPRTPTSSRIPIDFTLTASPIPKDTPVPPMITETGVPPTLTTTMPSSPTAEKQGVDMFPCVPDSPPILAEVRQVFDGDTIEVVISGVSFPVKYIGVEAPDMESVFGEDASAINRTLVEGRVVWLYPDVSERNEEGHLLRYVFVDNVFVNYEVLRLGYAAAVDVPPDTSCSMLFVETAQGAKNESQGLWSFIDLDEQDLIPTDEESEP